ncbi:hypothetical protein [Antrihabitans stalactiti]|uniref:Uncharacterized protein n=1 Tax=Antrihabitans stalactiti TaxID=2584121 RepID=A0A848KD31_9NOCA|nr:hypothetical protein [Antrihabitans stalactiti]NMN95074.1 hypothetical protein [Antrihabitans stalactiti]
MEVLAVVGAIAFLFVVGWIWSSLTEAVEDKASDLTDKAVYGQQRYAAGELGTNALKIRTSLASDKLWNELVFRLPLPSSKPRFVDSLYIAGELPSTKDGNHGLRVDWNECVRSAIFVIREADGQTVCEHAMLRWVDNGQAMRIAVKHFASLRENLVAIVASVDPHARAVLVDENDREVPFAPAQR